MSHDTPGWYLVGYDVASPRRLKKVHRQLKKRGLAVQKSLFFVHARKREMEKLLDDLALLIQPREDDLRTYPITRPGDVWSAGRPIPTLPLLHPGTAAADKPADHKTGMGGVRSWIRKIWRRRHPS